MKLFDKHKLYLIILLMITIFVSSILVTIIYQKYYIDDNPDFYVGQILTHEEALSYKKNDILIFYDNASYKDKCHLNDISDILNKNNVGLFYTNDNGDNSGGISFYNYDEFFSDNTYNSTEKIAFIVKNSFTERYLSQNDILIINDNNYDVLRYIGIEEIPDLLNQYDFFYSISEDTILSGNIYLYAKSDKDIENIILEIEEKGWSIITELKKPKLLDSVIKFYGGRFINKALVIGFLGIMLNLLLLFALYYKKSISILNYHHLYGSTLFKLYITTVIQWIILVAISSFISLIFINIMYSSIQLIEMITIFLSLLVLFSVYIIGINSFFFFRWKRELKKEDIL